MKIQKIFLCSALLAAVFPLTGFGADTNVATASLAGPTSLPGNEVITNLLAQIRALEAEAAALPPAQQKLATNLRDALRESRGLSARPASPLVWSGLAPAPGGRLLLDITATVTPALLQRIATLGGTVISQFPQYDAIRAELPLVGELRLGKRLLPLGFRSLKRRRGLRHVRALGKKDLPFLLDFGEWWCRFGIGCRDQAAPSQCCYAQRRSRQCPEHCASFHCISFVTGCSLDRPRA